MEGIENIIYIVEVYSSRSMEISSLIEEVALDNRRDAEEYVDQQKLYDDHNNIFHYYRIKTIRHIR